MAAAIRAVADGAKLNVSSANVGLLVYDFTAVQRDRKDKDGKALIDRVILSLSKVGLGPERISLKGTTKGITI